jgi:hypothetical protein
VPTVGGWHTAGNTRNADLVAVAPAAVTTATATRPTTPLTTAIILCGIDAQLAAINLVPVRRADDGIDILGNDLYETKAP